MTSPCFTLFCHPTRSRVNSLCAFVLLFAVLSGCSKPPTIGNPLSVSLENGGRLNLVWVRAGSFSMGSSKSEYGRNSDEAQFNVSLSHGYWIGETEVTIGQWSSVTGESIREHLTKVIGDETVYDFDGNKHTIGEYMNMSLDGGIDEYLANEDDDLPMYFTSWNDAMEFCEKLTQHVKNAGRLPEGYAFTLPTEAQWEYACRAGTTDAMFSNASLDDYAWYGANSADGYSGKGIGQSYAGPRKVATKLANPWGLYDMTGNLWEWCLDWYGPYPSGNVVDPTGPESGSFRVNRGGSFGSFPVSERSANRAKNPPAEASGWRGFRVVLSYSD